MRPENSRKAQLKARLDSGVPIELLSHPSLPPPPPPNLIIPQININSSPPPKQNQHPALFRFLLQRKRTKGFHNQARVKTLNFLTQDGIKIESSRTITYLSSRRDEITSPCDLSGNTRVQFSANEVFLRSVICSFYKTNTFSSILGVGVDGKNPQS